MKSQQAFLAIAAAVGLLTTFAGADDQLNDTVPVLGRIIEKNLAADGVSVSSLQWAYLKGKGVLFLGAVDLAQVGTGRKDAEKLSPEDQEWAVARQEVIGDPPVVKSDVKKTEAAVRSVESSLRLFSSRVPVGDRERIRVTLYENASSCGGCQLGASQKRAARQRVSAEDLGWLFWPVKGPFGRHAHTVSRGALVIDSVAGKLEVSAQQEEDASVLARVMGKQLARAFPDEYWGVDMEGRPARWESPPETGGPSWS